MKKIFKATIVVPTIREESILKFLTLWKEEFTGHRVIIVEDNPTKSFPLPKWVEHYCWEDIDQELGDKSWIIPRRSDCVRSYGYFKAWQKKTDFIVTLDDDCYPEKTYKPSYLQQMYLSLQKEWEDDRWWNTLRGKIIPRGYPYDIRKKKLITCINHGLWSNVPDLDALTQAKIPQYRTRPCKKSEKIPYGSFFPMCGMNLAFHPEAVPALYFLLMGRNQKEKLYPFDRFGDIWAGICIKKITDHLGFAISSGSPSVLHSRASNVEVNLKKETPGYPINEELWKKVSEIGLTGKTFHACYRQLAQELDMKGEYWITVKKAMLVWTSLFNKN